LAFARDFASGHISPECSQPAAFDCGRESGYPDFDDLFLHLYGGHATDPVPSAFDQSDPDDLSGLINYLKSAQPYSRMRLTLGRQRIFGGVTNDRVDGLKVSTGLGPWLSATAFGGLHSPLPNKNGAAGDLIYGARVATHPMSLYEIGLSYQKIKENTQDLEENAGADFTFRVGNRLTVKGLSNYNVEGRGWREHSYSALLKLDHFLVKPSYRYFQLDDNLDKYSVESHLFGFGAKNEEIVNIAGTDVLFRGFGPFQVGLRGRQYDYDLRDEKAFYYAGLLNLKTDAGSRLEVEAGRMEGETPENIYSLLRFNLYWRNPFHLTNSFFSADALYMDYDEPVLGQDGALHASLNGGLIFQNGDLEVKLSGIYSQDPYFHDNVGALMTFLLRF